MRILGSVFIGLAPLILGLKNYNTLILRRKTLSEILNIFNEVINQINYTNKELYKILQGYNSPYFIIESPIKANENFLKSTLETKNRQRKSILKLIMKSRST